MTGLPLNGRSYIDLLGLQAGVVPITSTSALRNSLTGLGSAGNFSVNGQRRTANSFLVNGADVEEAEITYGDSEFLLHVRDDGSGIDSVIASQGTRPGHWGLPGMRERAKSFGAKLEVWSEPGAGTEIMLRVPAAIAYSKSDARRRFWSLRRKTGQTDGHQS